MHLRGFCGTAHVKQQQEEKESKWQRLLDAFLSSKKDRLIKLTTASGNQQQEKAWKGKKKSKRVQVGWRNFREEVEDYVLVTLSKGGCSRYAAMLLSSNRTDVMKLCKLILFPNRVSYEKTEDMLFPIGTFHNEKLGSRWLHAPYCACY